MGRVFFFCKETPSCLTGMPASNLLGKTEDHITFEHLGVITSVGPFRYCEDDAGQRVSHGSPDLAGQAWTTGVHKC